MAGSRRRGAHAARPNALPFAPARRAPQTAAGGRAQLSGGSGGKRLNGLRGRTSLLRVIVAVAVVAFGAVGFAGGLWSSSSAEPTVQSFLLDWEQHQYRAAAALTTGDPAVVATALQTAYQRLDAAAYHLSMGGIVQHSGEAEAWFDASVDLGQDGAPWNYQGRFTLRQAGSGWKIQWSPAVIHPGLRPGLRLAVVASTPRRAPLLDASGRPLQNPSPVYAVGVAPSRLRDRAATAAALGKLTGLDPGQLEGQILAASQRPFVQLLTLSPQTYARLRSGLSRVPGLIVRPGTQRLFTSIASDVVGSVGTETSPQLRNMGVSYHPGASIGLSGLQRVYQRQLVGTPTTQVVAEAPDGHQVEVLARWPRRPAAPVPVRTTIETPVQQAANNAVTAAPGSAAIVAVQASTGRVLAVSDHPAPGLPRADPLNGHYAPGGAFTIVSTAALLADGLKVNTPIRCTSRNDVGGRTFTNVPAPAAGLGSEPDFAADFAHGCGTALAGLSRVLNERELATAAAGFGVGAGWRLPLSAFSGSLSSADGVAGLASSAIGRAGVQVSPLGMALVAGRVAAGGWHAPTLTPGGDPPGAAPRAAISVATIDTLRTLMRATVASGAASAADGTGQQVYGQVGVAPAGGKVWASWFVGYRGDVAFAVLELSRSAATSAVPAGAQFLSGFPPG